MILEAELKAFVENRPYLWNIAWNLIHRIPALLPHDNSYKGFAQLAPHFPGLVIDVGANNGVSALSLRKVGLKNEILSLEPNRLHAADLERVKSSVENFDYRLIGLSDQSGDVMIHTPIYKTIALHTFASLDICHLEMSLREKYGVDIFNRIEIRSETCSVKTLDALELHPSIIKIDTEGMEVKVLEGATRTIENTRPLLMFEIANAHVAELMGFANLRNYRPFYYSNKLKRLVNFSLERLDENPSRNIFAVPAEKTRFIR